MSKYHRRLPLYSSYAPDFLANVLVAHSMDVGRREREASQQWQVSEEARHLHEGYSDRKQKEVKASLVQQFEPLLDLAVQYEGKGCHIYQYRNPLTDEVDLATITLDLRVMRLQESEDLSEVVPSPDGGEQVCSTVMARATTNNRCGYSFQGGTTNSATPPPIPTGNPYNDARRFQQQQSIADPNFFWGQLEYMGEPTFVDVLADIVQNNEDAGLFLADGGFQALSDIVKETIDNRLQEFFSGLVLVQEKGDDGTMIKVSAELSGDTTKRFLRKPIVI